MKLYALLIVLLCIDYAFLTCYLNTDGMDVKKSDWLNREVGEYEVPEEDSHNPDTCCLISTSGQLGGQTIDKSYCAALEKAKASELEKERNDLYGALGTTTIVCEETSKSSNSTLQSTFIRYDFISFLLLFL